jgi:hypothetical protein
MPKKPGKISSELENTQFVLDLGQVELSDDDVAEVQNEITKLALEFARKKKKPPKGPYVKILHVKTVHVRTIKGPV